ncbi:MAG: ABC transporter permease, partial [Methylobacteriaceae bacterium]|nr:ABC transporter permease [Methylobacteriaceae bacterium]
GRWWPADYSGEPLVSVEENFARNIGLSIGDTLEVQVIGVPVKARVASFRRVDWASLNINFFLVFSPNAFAGVSHSQLVTLTFPSAPDSAFEAMIAREVAKQFPAVGSIRVKEALDTVNAALAQLILAIRAAGSVVLLAGFLVLAGAFASGQRRRVREMVILKTLGAARPFLMRVYLAEYLMLSLATTVFSVLSGLFVARVIISRFRILDFQWLLGDALLAALPAAAAAVALGLIGTWALLNTKPAEYLREL